MTRRHFELLRNEGCWVKHVDSCEPAALHVVCLLKFVKRAAAGGHGKPRRNVSWHIHVLFETFFESVGLQPHPLSILNEEASVVERLKRSRICGISPSSLVAHAPSRGVKKDSVEHNRATWTPVSSGKAWVFVLLEERHGKSLVVEKCDGATQEIVVANIPVGNWREISKSPQ